MYTHQLQFVTAGLPLATAKGALIALHGRGGSAHNIICLAQELATQNLAIYAPQATHNSWYPYSFLSPDPQNLVAMDSALELIHQLVAKIITNGIQKENIYFMGFSQGACLTLEYVARHASRFGGAVAFTGGLIGETLDLENYKGDFFGTPISITTGDPDTHVPVSRVEESVKILENLGAKVTLKVYKGRPHTIIQQEIDLANQHVFNTQTV